MEKWPTCARQPAEHSGLRLVFEDDFDGLLDRGKWSPYYLPHWSSEPLREARHRVEGGRLVLAVDPDDPPWCPEFDGDVRVAALQTGQFSGPLGGSAGQHRFRPELRVRRERPTERLYLPRFGMIVVRARTFLAPGDLASLYLIGFEERPEDSGEITVFEIFGGNVGADGAMVGHGVKAINDPRLVTDFREPRLPIEVGDWHEYAIVWQRDGIRFLLDGHLLGDTRQSPAYPMQLMLTCYRLEGTGGEGPRLEVDYVRGYAPAP